jgi:hypothetical protein
MIIQPDARSRDRTRRPGTGGLDAETRTTAVWRLIATAQDQSAAQRAHDWLTGQGLPDDRIAIVGRDLRPAPAPEARTTVQVAARGAVSGLIVGVLVGVVLGQTGLITSDLLLGWLTAALAGAMIGAIAGVLGYGLSASRPTTQPEVFSVGDFDVLVDVDVADEAERVLHRAAGPAE